MATIPAVAFIASSAIMILVVWAAWEDIKALQIPNRISILILALGTARLVLDALFGAPGAEWGIGLLFGTAILPFGAEPVWYVALLADLGLLVLVVLLMELVFRLGWLGGGDGKLIASLSVWFGWNGFAEFMFLTALAGGVLAFLIIAARVGVRLVPVQAALMRPALSVGMERVLFDDKRPPIPYAIAIAMGAIGAELIGATVMWSSLL